MSSKKNLKFDSKLIHSGMIDDQFGSATVPIYQTSTFKFKSAEHGAACFSGESDGYIYTRIGNPTVKSLEDLVADLENGFGGIATSSGMAAVNTVYGAFLEKGSHVICSSAVYGPSRVILETYYAKFGVEATFVNTAHINEIKDALRPNTKLLYVETPANPTLEISDLSACAKFAKENNIVFAVDNTFCSPYLQKPLDFGADVVLHSITKFLNGHADIVGGIVIAKDKALYTKMRSIMTSMGFNMDPHQAYLVIRGLKTLSIRVEQAQKSAMKIAEFLESHPKIEWVKYPGLKSHPHYELGLKQMKGPGTMISFELKGGIEAGARVMNSVELCILAVSLGGVETLIQHPASMTHSKMSKESRENAGITDGLVRFSVGIEDVNDILDDLKQALDKA